MNYVAFAEHRESYTFSGATYIAVANFVNNRLRITGTDNFHHECTLALYEAFDGNMEDFVKHIVEDKK